MRAEDFKNKSEEELLQRVDECLQKKDEDGVKGQPLQAALLLEAQLCMDEINRRHDATTSRRDYRMEWFVIVLICVEIILSLVGIRIGIKEGNQQTTVLEHLNKSSAATASTSQVTANALPNLIDEEATSLKSLDKMNTKLQTSIQKTSEMTAALQAQLDLALRQEEERSKRPILRITLVRYNFKRVSTAQVLDPRAHGRWDTFLLGYSGTNYYFVTLVLRNIGTADATDVKIEPEPSPGMSVVCVEDLGFRGYRYPAGTIQPCDVPSSSNITLPYRPNDRPEVASQSRFTPNFDDEYDTAAQIYMRVEKGVKDLDLAFSVTADGINPTRYSLFCHMFAER